MIRPFHRKLIHNIEVSDAVDNLFCKANRLLLRPVCWSSPEFVVYAKQLTVCSFLEIATGR